MTASNRLNGRVAIITGAARGIGLAAVKRLSEDGADIVAFDLPGSPLADAVNAAESAGRRAVAHEGDVSQADAWGGVIDAAQTEFGRIDILFNNAGIWPPSIPLEDLSVDQWRETVDVNVTGMESHAGTTPMERRKDALVGAAELITEIHLIAMKQAAPMLAGLWPWQQPSAN